MKTKVLSILCLFIVIAAAAGTGNEAANSKTINAAPGGDVSSIRAHRQAKGVEVSWGVIGDATGYIVEKTYQDAADPYSIWETVSSVAGNAASTTSGNQSKWFKVYDENVFPGFISYRIWTVQSNGSKTASPITVVHIMSRQ